MVIVLCAQLWRTYAKPKWGQSPNGNCLRPSPSQLHPSSSRLSNDRMIFRILASSLVAIQVLVSNAGAQSTDPCASVGTATLSTLADVYRCFNQIPASSSFKTEHVDTLKSFLEIYPFTDLNIDTTEPLFPNKVDIEAELDKLAADTSITTQFEFYSRIALLVKSLKDAHFSYSPSCITTFNFVQPWHIGAVYPNGGGTPQIKIINTVFSRTVPQQWQEALGATPSTFVNYTIQSIDDVDAVQYVKDFATKFSGFARDPESNFNRVLYRRLYTDGQWVGRTGPFYVTNFLGHDASPTRKYVLVPPNGGSSVTFSVPWIGVPEVDNFSSTSQYQRRYCTDAESSALVRRDNEETSGKSLILGEVPIPDSDLHVPTYRPTYRPLPDLSTVASISASVMQSSIASINIRGGVSAGAPKVSLQSPMAKDNNTAFYMLDDGITGVWVFATVSPDGEYDDVVPQWLGTITGGLRGLEAKGARRLIIDVSGNGGGYSCVADALAEVC
ncbi:hypothetical protein BC829DRAFT_420829 [Chytridium lagenaria]|nr:hypothetical protein BC829DRAFT_420829 [Chytridium lagenaria]